MKIFSNKICILFGLVGKNNAHKINLKILNSFTITILCTLIIIFFNFITYVLPRADESSNHILTKVNTIKNYISENIKDNEDVKIVTIGTERHYLNIYHHIKAIDLYDSLERIKDRRPTIVDLKCFAKLPNNVSAPKPEITYFSFIFFSTNNK